MNGQNATFLARSGAVNVAHIVERCRVLGPGERFAIWVQGCPLRCRGCHNPQFLPFHEVEWLTVDDLFERTTAVKGIEGVTYVGGEPFAQTQALAELSRRLKQNGLSVMSYSGFTLRQLESNIVPHACELLKEVDLLLDAPYHADQPTTKPWRGSDNQRLIALSDRYRDTVDFWNMGLGQEFEIRFLENGQVEFLGIPPASKAEASASVPCRCDSEHRSAQ